MNNLQLGAHTFDNTVFQKEIYPPVASELTGGTLILPDNLLFVYIMVWVRFGLRHAAVFSFL